MNKLEATIQAYKLCTKKIITGRSVAGVLPSEDYQACKTLLESHQSLLFSDDVLYKIEFSLPSANEGLFALDMEDLLEAPSRLLKPPKVFYLADKDYLSTSENSPIEVQNYLDISTFASTLFELADYPVEGNPNKAIYLQGEKLELSLKYNLDDLTPLEGLDKFIDEFIEADIHKEQKMVIIKSVLLEMLKNNEIHQFTLPSLIRRFSEFTGRVNANYQLYVSEFSFEKIKAQFENEKFEFTLKLNKVFSEIQNQLLAVPVALIVVGSQMELTDGFSLRNISIWLGALVFSFFMSLLIRNQRSTLNAIKTEMDLEWSSVEDEHA